MRGPNSITSSMSRKMMGTLSRHHDAAAESLQMRRLNAILSRNGITDECIPEAYFPEVLHMLLSEIGLDVVAEQAEELPQWAVRR